MIPDQNSTDDAFLQKMLAQTRTEKLLPLNSVTADKTDVHVYRVTISNGDCGLHFIAKG